jgi:hypothetical protein
MVHRTDIAGGSTGQTSPGNDCVCRHALNGALPEDNPSPDPLPASHTGRKQCCRLLTTAVPPVPSIYLELLTL